MPSKLVAAGCSRCFKIRTKMEEWWQQLGKQIPKNIDWSGLVSEGKTFPKFRTKYGGMVAAEVSFIPKVGDDVAKKFLQDGPSSGTLLHLQLQQMLLLQDSLQHLQQQIDYHHPSCPRVRCLFIWVEPNLLSGTLLQSDIMVKSMMPLLSKSSR